MTPQFELVVIGGGPSGMEAAISASKNGVQVALIDIYNRLGGQFYKQLSKSFKTQRLSIKQKDFAFLQSQVNKLNIKIYSATTVWDAFQANGSWTLYLEGPDAPDVLQARKLIIASGTYDRPIPFPGWTNPGVMTAGAVQVLIKSQRILPGRRFLLSGLGPLQLAVGAQLVSLGAEVVSVLEATQINLKHIRYAPVMLRQWSKLLEAWRYWWTLKSAKVPIQYGHATIEVKQKNGMLDVKTTKLDENMLPIPGTFKNVSVDTLVVGFGLQPSNELTRLIGCKHVYVPKQMYFVPDRNSIMETSVRGVFAVGDGAGVGGAQLARLEGRTAGIEVARQLDKLTEAGANQLFAKYQSALNRERSFAKMLNEIYLVKQGVSSWTKNDTLLCRCEEVTKKDIIQAVENGCEDLIWVKRITRAGMGMCQGRMCGQMIARIIAEQTGKDPKLVHLDKVRPPIRPVNINLARRLENDQHS